MEKKKDRLLLAHGREERGSTTETLQTASTKDKANISKGGESQKGENSFISLKRGKWGKPRLASGKDAFRQSQIAVCRLNAKGGYQ